MRFYKDTSVSPTSPDRIYIVSAFDSYDAWDVSYHRTKKGAYKWIMKTRYQEWIDHRYLTDWHYDYDYCVKEKRLGD